MEEKLESGVIKEENPEKRLNIKIKRETAEEFKKIAAHKQTSMSDIVRMLVLDYVEKNKVNY